MDKRSISLFKNTAILSIGTACTKGIMFLMTPLMAMWLTKTEYGIFDLLQTYLTLLLPILSLSAGEAIFRFIVDNDEESNIKNILSTAFLITLSGTGFLLILMTVYMICSSGDHTIFLIFFLLFTAENLNRYLLMSLRGLKKLKHYTISNILLVLIMGICVSIFAGYYNMGLKGVLLGYLFGYGIADAYMIYRTSIFKYLNFDLVNMQKVKDMLSYSVPLIPNSISWWIIDASDRTIVSFFLGPASNAILAVAYKLPNICQTFFGVFHISWQQNATESMNDKDRDLYYSNIMNRMFTVTGSISLMLLSCNYAFFKLLFSDEYFEGYYQVPIIMLSFVFSVLAQFIGGIYVAQKRSKTSGKTTVIAAVVNIAVHIILIKYIGIYAATISTLISYLLLFIIRYISINKETKLVFYKSSKILIIILIYFSLATYYINFYLILFNMIIAIVFFIRFNKDFILRLLSRIKNKL